MAPVRWCRTCVICRRRYSRLDNLKRKFMTKFPIDKDRCRQWVKIIGNEDLAYIPIEKLTEIKYVCGDHFQSKDFNKKKSRLKKWAVPSLFINRPPLSDHLLSEFPCHIAKSKQEPNKTYSSSELECSSSSVRVPTLAADAVQHDHNYVPQSQERTQDCRTPSSSSAISTVAFNPIQHDHNYCDPQSQDKTQDCPAPSSSVIFTVAVDTIQHDHNCAPQFQDKTQDCPAPSSSVISTVAVEAIQHDHNCDPQSQEKTQHCPAPSSSAVKIMLTSKVHAIQHDHNDDLQFQNKSQHCLDLTPRKKKLLKNLQSCKIKLRTLRKKIKVIESIDSPVLKTLISSTVKNQNRKHQARRHATRHRDNPVLANYYVGTS